MADKAILDAHKHSSDHRGEIEASDSCGCFYCLAIFNPEKIERWIWIDHGGTAICPKCGIDSVIGSASGLPIEIGFLKRMKDHWFSPVK
jgi:hypothetical protein